MRFMLDDACRILDLSAIALAGAKTWQAKIARGRSKHDARLKCRQRADKPAALHTGGTAPHISVAGTSNPASGSWRSRSRRVTSAFAWQCRSPPSRYHRIQYQGQLPLEVMPQREPRGFKTRKHSSKCLPRSERSLARPIEWTTSMLSDPIARMSWASSFCSVTFCTRAVSASRPPRACLR
jgi:hypothetical protein